MSKGKRNRQRRARDVAWEDQADATLRDVSSIFQRLHDGLVESNPKAASGATPEHMWQLLHRIGGARKLCQHAYAAMRNDTPRPVMYVMNLNLLACPSCLYADREALEEQFDRRCDYCGRVPENNQYHDVVANLGFVLAWGHYCPPCYRSASRRAKQSA